MMFRDKLDRIAGQPQSLFAFVAFAAVATGDSCVLRVGMMVVGVYLPFVESRVPLANAGLFAIVAAELVNSVVVLLSYRRRWHG